MTDRDRLSPNHDWERFSPPWNYLGPQFAAELRRIVGSSAAPKNVKPLKVGELPAVRYITRYDQYRD